MAVPFACDRCMRAIILSPTGSGDARPMVSLRMPHNPSTGMSEGLDFQVCADCYSLAREFMGIEPNTTLIDGWKSRELQRSRQLPTLTYQKELPRGPAGRKSERVDK